MLYIKDSATLEAFCTRIADEPYITFDTEFLRETSYRPELCLIQIAAKDEVALIDVFEKVNLKPLFALFRKKDLIKVCHSGRQDLEIFYTLMGEVPFPIFDTQIAAMCAGYGDQIAYHKLVFDICGVKLEKMMQVTNWKQRPLSSQQLDYAVKDVTYLRKIYAHLIKHLKKQKRIKWVEEEIETLINPANYKFRAALGWEKLKLKCHNPKQMMVAKQIALWREEEAEARNKNRRAILKDEVIYELSIVQPKNLKSLQKMRHWHKGGIEKYAKILLELVEKALKTPSDQWPKMLRRQERNSEEIAMLLEASKLILKKEAARHHVASKLITTNKELEAYLLGDLKEPIFMQGWRFEIFGKTLKAFLSGEVGLHVEEGKHLALQKLQKFGAHKGF